MTNLKHFVLWSLIFIVCIMTLVMNVYVADRVIKLSGKIDALSLQSIPDTPNLENAHDGFPYTVKYDGKTIFVTDVDENEVYKFDAVGINLPQSEKDLLAKGITFYSMDDVWSLIESYTS